MRSKLTDEGVNLPREWFEGATEVEIRREGGRVVVVAIEEPDPIYSLGKNPIEDDITDASVNHDKYLYGLRLQFS